MPVVALPSEVARAKGAASLKKATRKAVESVVLCALVIPVPQLALAANETSDPDGQAENQVFVGTQNQVELLNTAPQKGKIAKSKSGAWSNLSKSSFQLLTLQYGLTFTCLFTPTPNHGRTPGALPLGSKTNL